MYNYGLKSLRRLKIHYTRGIDDPLEEFLIPCLNNSNECNLITGYFSSGLIKRIFYKIENFIKNGGKINILTGWIWPQDLLIGEYNKEKLQKYIGEVIENLLDDFDNQKLLNHKKLFAFLLFEGLLTVKFGTPIDRHGRIGFIANHILHEKVGYFKDKYNNIISYSGSINSTPTAWFENREEFKVFNSWEKVKKDYCKVDVDKFERYWNNLEPGLSIYDIDKIPEKIKEKILKSKPTDLSEIEFSDIDKKFNNEEIELDDITEKYNWLYYKDAIIPKIELLKLRICQIKALDSLKENNYSNLLAMATGSGKTIAALRAAYEIIKENEFKKFLIIVCVPDLYLVSQWSDQIKDFTNKILEITSKNPSWKVDYLSILESLEYLKSDFHYFFVGTSKSLKKEIYYNISKSFNVENIIFIGDEVHSLGAPISRFNLENFKPKYRIGLTATPIRKFDDEGTNFLFKWFNTTKEKTFLYTIKNGQEDNYLEEFNYYFELCNLSDNRFEEYISISEKISKTRFIGSDDSEKRLSQLLSNRARIIKKEETKLVKLDNLIRKLITENKLIRTVIFCHDKDQLGAVENILRNIRLNLRNDISWQIIIGDEARMEQRKLYIDSLEDEKINLLLAIKCLDQGVDIPSLERAIFMASSGSEREHIQRAGRIIRKVKNYIKNVEIYDLLVLPTEEQIQRNKSLADHIKNSEKERAYFFAKDSRNYIDATMEILDL